ncbi:MAG: beta-ketoacyl-ACP synthase II [Gammaproteobacteria bacterium]|nr:beta-ketoacyl-ACP synthase II [Gammaproteobacteria bacterium]
MAQRVVVTGLGLVAPNGNTVAASWQNTVNGVSGIGPIESFDASGFASRIAGEIKNFDITKFIPAKEARKMDPFIHYGLAAAIEAIEDSGIVVTEANAKRIGTIIGSGIGGLPGIEKGYQSFLDGGPRRISPFFVPSNIINMVAGNLSIKYGLKGPNYAIVSACSTGAHSIGLAARTIERGEQDVIIAGGAEFATCPTGIGGFASAKALSTRNDDPTRASRPWDAERDGFVLSDGAGVVVLESLDHARARGARIYAELVGFGINSDAYHMTAPSPNGEGAADCMALALADAKLNPEDVDYINAHGTSTPAGDKAETDAVKRLFKEHAYKVAMSSTKSMVGHMLGAAGGAEAVYSILALRDQVAPPTINLTNPDPECDLDYVPNVARPMNIRVALSNSFGFGGTNGTLVFRRFEG